jgi:hypothetical protein
VPTRLALPLLACGLLLLVSAPGRADDTPWQDAPPAQAPAPPANPPDAAPPPAADNAADDSASADDAKCLITKLPWKASSTRVAAVFEVDGQDFKGLFLGVPFMMIEYKLLENQHHRVDIKQVQVLDYSTFGTDAERMITINDDWSNVVFVHTDQKLAGSKAPYYAAFSDADKVDQAKKDLNGSVLSYKDLLTHLLRALDAPAETTK